MDEEKMYKKWATWTHPTWGQCGYIANEIFKKHVSSENF